MLGLLRVKQLIWTCLLIGLVGCSAAPATLTPLPTIPPPTATPISTRAPSLAANQSRTPLPSLTPLGGVASATAVPVTKPLGTPSTPIPLVPSSTSALIALTTATASVNSTATITNTPISAQPGSAPPFTVDLPPGWTFTYTLVPINDIAGAVTINLAAYSGVVSGGGGRGFIFVLWNFPTLMPISPRALPTSARDVQEQASLSDGYRLLRGSILDSTCAVNIYGRNYYKVAGRDGIGQIFQTSACQDNRPDIIGWYSGLWEGGKQFLFYSYVEPPNAFNNGRSELQAILNTVKFDSSGVPAILPSPSPAPTGGSAPRASTTPLLLPTPTRATPTATPELN